MGIQGGAGKGLGETENGKKGFNQQTSLWESREATHDSDPPPDFPTTPFHAPYHLPASSKPGTHPPNPDQQSQEEAVWELELHRASMSSQEPQEQVVS